MRTALLWLALAGITLAQGLVKPEGFVVKDRPDDEGGAVLLTWETSKSDAPGVKYVLTAALKKDGPWLQVGEVDAEAKEGLQTANEKLFWFRNLLGTAKGRHFAEVTEVPDAADPTKPAPMRDELTFPLLYGIMQSLQPGKYPKIETPPYFFKLEMVRGDERLLVGEGSLRPRKDLFDSSKSNILVVCVGFCALVLVMIRRARKNPDMFVRRIPGLDAVDEAIGRATEMGKPVLYLNGLLGMESISTIASTSILGRLARRIAQYDSQILVPCYDPVVLPICQEIVREAYLDAGRPDAFREESIYFLSNDQFSYVAAVDGIMMRDKPAANFYMGYYYAESLLLAETGAATGAIQIAGTDSVTQLPFFIAACDYTLIGEELYAASAYLSRDPMQLGSLKGLDYGKAVLIGLILVGTLSISFGVEFFKRLFATY